MPEVAQAEIERLYLKLKKDAEGSGYFLNLANEGRYGYRACPCRLADGEKSADLDIICPCDYRDADLDQYDTCY